MRRITALSIAVPIIVGGVGALVAEMAKEPVSGEQTFAATPTTAASGRQVPPAEGDFAPPRDAPALGMRTVTVNDAKGNVISISRVPHYTGPEGEAGLSRRFPGIPVGEKVPLQKQNGVLVVPVLINHSITLNFAVDSGAADVTIPAEVVDTLRRTGTIQNTDLTGQKMYTTADGSSKSQPTFRIRSLRVGNRTVEDVMGSQTPTGAPLLLGQSFLSRFTSWSVDNRRQVLVLE